MRLPAHGARRQREGRPGARVQVPRCVLGEQEGRVEADHGGPLDVLERGVGELDRREGVAGRVDDVVEFRGPLRPAAAPVEEVDDVGFDGRRGQVAGVAGDAAAGARVGLEELVDAGVDAGLLRGGDGDRGAELEAGFRDAVAYARAAADDEDAGAGELVAVSLAVGHVERFGLGAVIN